MRCGEGLALEWADVNIKKRYIMITKSLSVAKARDEEGNPIKNVKMLNYAKTDSGYRKIPLNDKAIELIEQIVKFNKANKIETKYVISTETGNHVSYRNFQRKFDCMLGSLGFKHYGLHALRHTFASKMLRSKIEVSVVSKLLGHADINTTYRTYIHIIEEQKIEAITLIPAI